MHRVPTIVLPLLMLTLLASCAQPDEAPRDTASLTEETVSFGEQLAQIKGHYIAATELYAAGDTKGAATHTGHPVEELLDVVKTEVAEHDEATADELADALPAVSQVVADDGSPEELSSAVQTAEGIVDDAAEAVLGDLRDTTTYKASVIAALVTTVAHEYEEAVQKGKVTLVAEYQDAYAFSKHAAGLYSEIEAEVKEEHAEEAAEIDEDFEALDAALPSVKPRDEPVELDLVEQPAQHIADELAETTDALAPESDVDADEAFENIDSLLDEISATYADGDPDEAAELAAEAYLANYELIEADVIAAAPDVNKELEPLLGFQIRAAIKDDVEPEELDELIEQARRLLMDARDALEGH